MSPGKHPKEREKDGRRGGGKGDVGAVVNQALVRLLRMYDVVSLSANRQQHDMRPRNEFSLDASYHSCKLSTLMWLW